MATVKIKFKPSTIDGRQGVIVYQVTHNRVTRQQKTGYRLYVDEWNYRLSEVILSKSSDSRKRYLLDISNKIRIDIRQFGAIITLLESSKRDFTTDDILSRFLNVNSESYLFPFMESMIEHHKTLGKIRTAETYAATLRSFRRFRNNEDLALDDINSDTMIAYEVYLKVCGVSHNSSSFYMRNLRAVYNRAVEKELTLQRYPFKNVYTGVDKTTKRALPLKEIKHIKNVDLSNNTARSFARDMFLFSFYTRGMSFVDMAYLQKKDLNRGILSYRRRKTGQLLFIKWEKCMQEIVDKYNLPQSNYLLPIIKPMSKIDERKQYLYSSHKINRNLKILGEQLGLSIPLTMYVSRHAWASIAKSKNIPISIISEGLGHDSEATTRIYLASLDTIAIDKANRIILQSL